MLDFKKQYNYKLNCITLDGFYKFCQFVNYCGGDIDVDRCTSGLSYTITLKDGESYRAGGFSGVYQLFEKINELYDLKINLQRSSRVGHVFNVHFEETPTFVEQPTQIVEEPTVDVPEPFVEPELVEISTEDGGHFVDLSGAVLEPVPEENIEPKFEPKPEPDWKELRTVNGWTKDKLDNYAKEEYNIELDKRVKYTAMINDFKAQYNRYYKQEV